MAAGGGVPFVSFFFVFRIRNFSAPFRPSFFVKILIKALRNVCVCVCSFSLERGIVDHLTFKIGEVCGEECVRSWKLGLRTREHPFVLPIF